MGAERDLFMKSGVLGWVLGACSSYVMAVREYPGQGCATAEKRTGFGGEFWAKQDPIWATRDPKWAQA